VYFPRSHLGPEAETYSQTNRTIIQKDVKFPPRRGIVLNAGAVCSTLFYSWYFINSKLKGEIEKNRNVFPFNWFQEN
jgi:hypothetical protein